jgi:hypothetical protein
MKIYKLKSSTSMERIISKRHVLENLGAKIEEKSS